MTENLQPGQGFEPIIDSAREGESDTHALTETGALTETEVARQRLQVALKLSLTRSRLMAAGLALVLGFVLVTVVRGTSGPALLVTAREDELVRLLDDLGERATRLESERQSLLAAQSRLESGDQAARLQEAARRLDALAMLVGTVPAKGPGITVTIGDPKAVVGSAVLLDAVQELRDAGATAIQIDQIRIVASTWFGQTSQSGSAEVVISGTVVKPPYRIRAIGSPQTLAVALEIPGGVADTVRTAGGTIYIDEKSVVAVTALHTPTTPSYARPAASPSG